VNGTDTCNGRLKLLRSSIGKMVLVFERKIVRRIFGPTTENQIWRIKIIEKLNKLIKHKNIVNYIKAQRLSWFGHVQRMSDTGTDKKIFYWKPLT
jgi:capsule polysaccharide modification protein KpsS